MKLNKTEKEILDYLEKHPTYAVNTGWFYNRNFRIQTMPCRHFNAAVSLVKKGLAIEVSRTTEKGGEGRGGSDTTIVVKKA